MAALEAAVVPRDAQALGELSIWKKNTEEPRLGAEHGDGQSTNAEPRPV